MKGMPIDYDFFVKLSKKTKINIIADSAESFGAKYKKKFVGSQLLAHTFSFFANKNITTGEGGMVVTNNKILKNKLKIIRNQGQNKRYNHIVLGNNYRMTDINASIGIEQLKKLKKTIIEKERVSKKYNKIFMNVKEVKTPYIPSYVSQHSWYNYTIKVPSNIRDSLVKFLYKKNVETRLSFPPVHIQPYYKKKYKYKNNSFKKSFKTYSEFIDLPIWANLSQKQILYIGNIIINFLKKK